MTKFLVSQLLMYNPDLRNKIIEDIFL